MELISTVCSTFSRKPLTNASPRLSLLLACPLCLFSHVYLQLKIRVKITFSVHLDFDLCSIFLRCRLEMRIEAKAFLSWGQDCDELGVYWLHPRSSIRFHLLARRQTASEIWLAPIIKSDIFIPPILGTASEHLVALMPGKACSFDR